MRHSKKMLGALGLALALVFLPVEEGVMLTDYVDPVGVPTACMGHTRTAKVGTERTLLECYRLMYEDTYEAYEYVQQYVTVPLTSYQLSALVMFTYNLGPNRLRTSTLLRKLNAGDYDGATNEFRRWVYGTVKGKKVVLPGLVKRRQLEEAMFRGMVELDTGAFDALPEVASAEELEEIAASDEYVLDVEVDVDPEPVPLWKSLLGPSFFTLRAP